MLNRNQRLCEHTKENRIGKKTKEERYQRKRREEKWRDTYVKMAHQLASSVNCSLDEIDLNALKVSCLVICLAVFVSLFSRFSHFFPSNLVFACRQRELGIGYKWIHFSIQSDEPRRLHAKCVMWCVLECVSMTLVTYHEKPLYGWGNYWRQDSTWLKSPSNFDTIKSTNFLLSFVRNGIFENGERNGIQRNSGRRFMRCGRLARWMAGGAAFIWITFYA